MNKVILLGRLTRDPEVRYSQSAEPMAIARYTIAVNRRFKREGEPDADFINCVAFGKSAEFAERYFKKGMRVSVVGNIRVSSWDDQSGQKRWSTDVVIEEQHFADGKGSSGESPSSRPLDTYMPPVQDMNSGSAEPPGFTAITESLEDDDLPF